MPYDAGCGGQDFRSEKQEQELQSAEVRFGNGEAAATSTLTVVPNTVGQQGRMTKCMLGREYLE